MPESSIANIADELVRPAEAPSGANAFARLLDALKGERKVRTQGLKGAARGYVLARVARQLAAPLVCVAADEDEADHLASDLAFFLGGAGDLLEPNVLRLSADEVLPYDDLSPNPVVVSERLAALFHLRQGTPISALVLSQRALYRKHLPPGVVDELSELIGVGEEYERDALA